MARQVLGMYVECYYKLNCAVVIFDDVGWRWYKHRSKHAISRCVDKRGYDRWRMGLHMCTHNIRRCEMLGLE